MQQFLMDIIATISVGSLVIYDLLSICRIIGKEELVEKIWRKVLPNQPFNEKIFFTFTRPIFLSISLMAFILSGGMLSEIPGFNIFLSSAPLLAFVVMIKNNMPK